MKKVLLTLSLLLAVLQGARADYWQNDGVRAASFSQINETDKTITVTTAAELGLLGYNVNNGVSDYEGWTVLLGNDINLSGHDWLPIGTKSGDHEMKGIFDGQNHTIKNLHEDQSVSNIADYTPLGLFASIPKGAVVKNLVIEESTLVGGTRLGLITAKNSGTITNCHTKGSNYSVRVISESWDFSTGMNETASAGGLVGLNNGTIEGCTCYCEDVAGQYYAGGIAGENRGTITDCIFFGNNVSFFDRFSFIGPKDGPIVGYDDGNVTECYYTNGKWGEGGCMHTYDLSKVKRKGEQKKNYGLMTTYGNGIAFDGKFYAKLEKVVLLNESDGAYLIEEDEDWESLAHHVSEGYSFDGKTVKLTGLVNANTMVGSEGHYFCGNFDGQGYTIYASIDNSWEKTNPNPSVAYTAPFAYVKKASIQNVKVSGSIKGGIHTAGLVGKVVEGDETTIKSCMVDAFIKCDHASDGSLADHGGGFIGHGTKAKISVEGCLFKGEIVPATGESDSYAGAIVGWCEDKTNITVTNCVDMGTYGSYFTYKGMNWSHNNGTGITSFAGERCYSTNGVNASTKVFSITSGTPKMTLDMKAGDNDPQYIFAFSDLCMYTDGRTGFLYKGARYAAQDEDVRFGIVVPSGYAFNEVKVNGTAVAPDDNKYYNWKMTAANAVVTAEDLVAQKWTDDGNYALEFPAVDEANHTITIKTERELARYAHDFNAEELPMDYQYNNGWTLKLDADLDMSAYYWEPFANGEGQLFYGVFDGQGHTINGLRMDDETKIGAAFIGNNVGTIKNLKIDKSAIKGNEIVAAIAARNYNTIENCYVGSDVEIEGKESCVGSVAGWMGYETIVGSELTPQIVGCVTHAKVTGNMKVGGIVGEIGKGAVKQCIFAGPYLNCTSSLAHLVAGEYPYSDDYYSMIADNYYIGATLVSDHEKDVKAFPYTTNNEKFQVKLVGDATTFDVSGLAFYQDNNAFAYDGKVYGGKGKTVTFDVTNSNGQVYPISDIKVNGTNVSKGDGGHFSWTTENNAVLDINFDVIELKEFEDNSTVISENTPSLLPVNVQLTGHKFVKDGSWNTLCLPFPVVDLENSPLKGATIKTLSDATYSNGTLTLTFVDDTRIENGRPYLVKWDSGEDIIDPLFTNVIFANESNFEDFTNVMFMGSFNPTNITGEDRSVLYLGEHNTLYYPNAAMTIGSCHAYFWLKGITAGDVANGARVVMNFDNGGTTTGISSVATGAASRGNATTDGTWYTLDGRKLDGKPTTKGIFIVNGRKVVIK